MAGGNALIINNVRQILGRHHIKTGGLRITASHGNIRIAGNLERTEAKAGIAITKDHIKKLKKEISRVKGVHAVSFNVSVPEEKEEAGEEASREIKKDVEKKVILSVGGLGARKFLFDLLMREQALDREALIECDRLRAPNNQTLAEVLVSEGLVTDQDLGRMLEAFADEGRIAADELGRLLNSFSSNWERWKDMEERDESIGVSPSFPETEEETDELEAEIPVEVELEAPAAGDKEPSEEEGKTKPLTERIHRGSLQQAFEELMERAPDRDYTGAHLKAEEGPPVEGVQAGPSIPGLEVVSKLGEGQFGLVYKCTMKSSGDAVVARVISSVRMPVPRHERLLKALKAATKIDHRNVARLISVGEEPEFIYAVSEFVEGESLRARLDRDKTLPQGEALDAALEVARALRGAHAEGCFHRDIKPENILIGKSGQVLVTDFGLPKSAEIDSESAPREASLMMGMPHYMAPEQFEAKQPPDARTDIYALGVVLYEMLSGTVPFKGPTAFAIRDAHMRGRPLPLTDISDQVDTTVAKLVGKMIAKEPDQRYQMADGLINDMVSLKNYLATGEEEPAIARIGASGPPELDPDVRARATKYKTVALEPPKKAGFKLPKLRYILLVAGVIGAVALAAYALMTKRDIVKQQERVEDKAAEIFEEFKGKAGFLLSQRKYVDILKLLDTYPSEYTASEGYRKLLSYRGLVFSEADKDFSAMQNRISEFMGEERIEDAQAINRALKAKAGQIVKAYGERFQGVKALAKYRDFAEKMESDIVRTQEQRKNFERDMKIAAELLANDKVDDAQKKVDMYLTSLIAKHRVAAEGLGRQIAARKKFLGDQAALEKELEKFQEDIKTAKALLEQQEFDKAIALIEQYEKSKQQRIRIEVMPVIARIRKERGKYLAEREEKKRRENFVAAYKKGQNLIKEGKFQEETFEAVLTIVKKYEDDKRLTQEEKAQLAELKAAAEHKIKFLEELEESSKLLLLSEDMRTHIALMLGRTAVSIAWQAHWAATAGTSYSAACIVDRALFPRKQKYSKARELCLRWLKDPDKRISKRANAKYLKVMNAREPGMVYIVGGVAVIGSNDNMAEVVIGKFDSNRDGRIGKNEFAGPNQIFNAIDKNSNGFITKDEMVIEKFDSNGDGKISREEFVIAPDMFDKADKNSDGFITKDDYDNNPERKMYYRTFYIDRHEVTCAQYAVFLEATKHPAPAGWPEGLLPGHPVTGVTWEDAAAYAKWAGKRLPTEVEWEIAASWDGEKKTTYPWGDKFSKSNANIASGHLKKVGSRRKDKSPNGVFDMAGNAAEWTATKSGEDRVVRGGSAQKDSGQDSARTTRRVLLPPGTKGDFLGFRCAKDPG